MKNFLFPFACASLLFGSCQTKNLTSSRYHEDGRAKPVVALLPIANRTQVQLPWDVSQELTQNVQERIAKDDMLYLVPSSQASQLAAQINLNTLSNASFDHFRKIDPRHNFIVLIELLEHSQLPCNAEHITLLPAHVATLQMKCRLTIIEIRASAPKILLQQILVKQYPLKSVQKDIDYNIIRWQEKGYLNTPWSQLHARMEKEIIKRIETYIHLARG